MNTKFYSNGKLLLTGEYAVLDAALSLAIPTKYGQSLSLQKINTPQLRWKSLEKDDSVWFSADLSIEKDAKTALTTLSIENKEKMPAQALEVAETLVKIITEAIKMNPEFLSDSNGYSVETKLTFCKNWGLGSSSTLINNIASWAKVDAYKLLWNSFSGSAFDIACAQHNYPITYKLEQKKPVVEKIDFNPSFKNQLYFVYLNKKQNSREGIAKYQSISVEKSGFIVEISKLTIQISKASTIAEFDVLIETHEQLIAKLLQIPTVRESTFPDFPGGLKSLGAWGGDFVLATGTPRTMRYFKRNGYNTIIPYKDMVL